MCSMKIDIQCSLVSDGSNCNDYKFNQKGSSCILEVNHTFTWCNNMDQSSLKIRRDKSFAKVLNEKFLLIDAVEGSMLPKGLCGVNGLVQYIDICKIQEWSAALQMMGYADEEDGSEIYCYNYKFMTFSICEKPKVGRVIA